MGGESDHGVGLVATGEDTSWLDGPDADEWLKIEDPNADEWLKIEDPNAGQTTAAFRHLIDACMRGTDRVMACDGNYLAYRPYNREKDKETNPRTKERFQMFCEKGFYRHVGTYDEVQIYELLEGNPYRHNTQKQYVAGQSYWKDIKQAADLACSRNWSEYHDFLGAMATALKGGGRDPGFARTMWLDAVNQITAEILRRPGAPTEKEINDGFVGVRRARGITGNNGVVLLNSNALQKVSFSKSERA